MYGDRLKLQRNGSAGKCLQQTAAPITLPIFSPLPTPMPPLIICPSCFPEPFPIRKLRPLSIATRPDCLPDETIALLSSLNRIKPVWVELGLQTIHEDTARLIRRGYALSVFEEALKKLKAAGLTVIVHVILGLPGESRERMTETIAWLADRPIDGIKLQLLHVLKGTDLGSYVPV